MSQWSVPVTPDLVWRRMPGQDLNTFTADIDGEDFFLIHFDAEQPEGYQWRVIIAKRETADKGHGVFLHGHTTLEDAKDAAARHVGDNN